MINTNFTLKQINSWDEFITEINKLMDMLSTKKQASTLHVSSPLFRGQSNANWGLTTTLERHYPGKKISFSSYYSTIFREKTKFESFTGKEWPILDPVEYNKILSEESLSFLCNFHGYEYFTYLRHHGFPSPLLDWSSSPYIATFFAFRSPPENAEKVALYTYLEYNGHTKSYSTTAPHIWSFGPNVRTHKRHFLQQSQYTICLVDDNNILHYDSHDGVFNAPSDLDQDKLWKFEIPISQRKIFLEKLYQMNISAHSLFESEDSLSETIASLLDQ